MLWTGQGKRSGQGLQGAEHPPEASDVRLDQQTNMLCVLIFNLEVIGYILCQYFDEYDSVSIVHSTSTNALCSYFLSHISFSLCRKLSLIFFSYSHVFLCTLINPAPDCLSEL